MPLDGGKVTDDTRIRETLPTLQLAMDAAREWCWRRISAGPRAKLDPKYSLAPVAARLRNCSASRSQFAADCVGADAEAKSKALRNGDVLLLENVRFHPEEEANDPDFRSSSPRSAMGFSFAMRSVPRIARTLRWSASRSSCARLRRVC